MKIKELVINEDRQYLMIDLSEPEISGRNLWGGVVGSIGNMFVVQILKAAVEKSSWSANAVLSEDGRELCLDLSGLAAVKKLVEARHTKWNIRPVKHVSVCGACHRNDGVAVILDVSDKLAMVVDGAHKGVELFQSKPDGMIS